MAEHDTKARRIQQVQLELQGLFGKDALRPASEITSPDTRVRPTGIDALDTALLSGGIPQGQITELVGEPTSGKTTLGYKIMATAQEDGGGTIYVDVNRSYDADFAKRMGVFADRILLVRPSPEKALEIAREIVAKNSAEVVVLDLSEVELRYKADSWQRLQQSVRQSHTAFVVLSAPTAHHDVIPSAVRMRFNRVGWLHDREDIIGYQVQATLLKHPTTSPNVQAHFEISFDDSDLGEWA